MNKDNFYIDDLASIRAFCINSDKEDVYKYIYSLQQENKELKDNWNKLKEYINKYIKYKTEKGMTISKHICAIEVLDKIQEIESSDSND